jgi:hypothetical protein
LLKSLSRCFVLQRLPNPFRYFNGAYFADTATAAWVSPQADGNAGPAGTYTYDLVIDLTGLDPATASITGNFGTGCRARAIVARAGHDSAALGGVGIASGQESTVPLMTRGTCRSSESACLRPPTRKGLASSLTSV